MDCSGILLIPMATIVPPTQGIAPNQLHANLCLLQMELFEEFSNNSKELSQYKCIKITREKMIELIRKANIPIKYIDPILDGWIKDGNDAPRVIKQVDKEHYTLGEAYEKLYKFLIEQGKIRIQQSHKGKASAQKKKKHRKR